MAGIKSIVVIVRDKNKGTTDFVWKSPVMHLPTRFVSPTGETKLNKKGQLVPKQYGCCTWVQEHIVAPIYDELAQTFMNETEGVSVVYALSHAHAKYDVRYVVLGEISAPGISNERTEQAKRKRSRKRGSKQLIVGGKVYTSIAAVRADEQVKKSA